MLMMKCKTEQIETILRNIELEVATSSRVCEEAQITAQTFYRWGKEFGVLIPSGAT